MKDLFSKQDIFFSKQLLCLNKAVICSMAKYSNFPTQQLCNQEYSIKAKHNF